MAFINPLQVILWTFRRNERDVINLYNSLSPVMRLATGGDMLNFGYWDGVNDPISAQRNLCSLVGNIAELSSGKSLIDVGSGLGAPAKQWKKIHDPDIVCVNINRKQLLFATESPNGYGGISSVNATCTALPMSNQCADRIVALESAQHFRPLGQFIEESRRVLKEDGLLVMALPILKRNVGHWKAVTNLGILSFTWSSEHYDLEYVKNATERGGFTIKNIRHIGRQVYEPLADYYIENRQALRRNILSEYPSFVEGILYKSLLKMKDASASGIIDYAIIDAQ